jgi:hypothetical protein
VDKLETLLKRPAVFVVALGAHMWSADRLRQRLSTSPDELQAQAYALADVDLGHPSNGADDDDWLSYQHHASQYLSSLKSTESYLWGLGVAGLFHQWEREMRQVAVITHPELKATEKSLALEQIKAADFSGLCRLAQESGFDPVAWSNYAKLDETRLIANAIKHGQGTSLTSLAGSRPDLFQRPQSIYSGSRPPTFDDLMIGQSEFDATDTVILQFWIAYEEAFVGRQVAS